MIRKRKDQSEGAVNQSSPDTCQSLEKPEKPAFHKTGQGGERNDCFHSPFLI